jgi:hypothetical protein
MQIHVKQKTKKKQNGNFNLHTFANLQDNLITSLQQFVQNLMNRATLLLMLELFLGFH